MRLPEDLTSPTVCARRATGTPITLEAWTVCNRGSPSRASTASTARTSARSVPKSTRVAACACLKPLEVWTSVVTSSAKSFCAVCNSGCFFAGVSGGITQNW